MGKGGNQGEGAPDREAPMPTFSWEEIQKHNLRTDKWLVIDRKVYNITKWSSRHPGGHRVIGHYAGEDATVRVWGLPPPLSAEGGSRGPRFPGRQPSAAARSLGRPRGKESVSMALASCSESLSRGTEGPPAVGVGLGPREGGRARSVRIVRDLPGAHAAASSAGFAGTRDAPKRALGPQSSGAPAWKMAAPGAAGRSQV